MFQDLKTQYAIELIAELESTIEIMAKHNIDSRVIHALRKKLECLRLMTAHIENRVMLSAVKESTGASQALESERIAMQFRPVVRHFEAQ
jgi:hypothetical protein